MLASTLALALALSLFALPAHANETFPVVLQLPVVTMQSPSGEERKMEISLAGELTIGGGKATLRNVRLQSPQPGDLQVSAGANRALRSLFMEVASFELASQLFGAQISHFADKSLESFAEKPFRITEPDLTLWDIPLRFSDSKPPLKLTGLRFVQDESGTVVKVTGTAAGDRAYDLADLEPQMESLNPWDAISWILAGRVGDVGTVRLVEGGKARVIDLTKASLKKRLKDEADRIFLRGQITYRTKAQAKEQKEKADDETAKGCLGCAACGCAIVVAGGGICVGVGYWILSWLI